MKRYIFILMLVCLGVAGCRSHKELKRDDGNNVSRDTTAAATAPSKPHAERLDTIMNAQYRSITANFNCTVQGINVNGQLRMAKDSIIWVSVNKLLELGRAQLTPTKAQAYAKLIGKKYDLSYNDIQKNWGIDVDFVTLQALLTANCPPQCRKSKEPQRNGDIVTLWFDQNNGQRQLTLKKDFATKRPVAATLQSKQTGQTIELTYSNWTSVEGQLLPTTINISVKSKQLNEQTVITLERITLNKTQSYPFKM